MRLIVDSREFRTIWISNNLNFEQTGFNVEVRFFTLTDLAGDEGGVVDEEQGQVGHPTDDVQPRHLLQASVLATAALLKIPESESFKRFL